MTTLLVPTNPTDPLADQLTTDIISSSPLAEPDFTLEWIRSQISSGGAQSDFRVFHRICRFMDVFYNGEFDFFVPEGGDKIRLGTFRSVIKTLVSHVTPQSMDITVPPPGPRGLARAELIEEFLSGAHHCLEENTPIRRDLIRHQGLYGVAWGKIAFEATRWGKFPTPPEEGELDTAYKEEVRDIITKRNINFPIVGEAVNPQELVWDHASLRPRWVIRQYQTDASWVAAHFPAWKEGQNGRARGKVTFTEAWGTTKVAYMANNEWAMPSRPHGYLTLPYIQFRPNMGNVTVGRRPEDLYQGIVAAGELDMMRAESRMFSQFITVTGKNAWPVDEFSGPRGLTEEVMNSYETSPGSRNYLPPGVERQSSEVSEATQTVIVAKDMVGEAIEDATVPAVARGQRPTGAASGFHTAVLAGIATLNFGAVLDATQNGFQEINRVMLHIVENVIRDSVTVYGKTDAGTLDARIKPSQINGHYVNIVRFSSVSPEEAERKLNLWSNLWRTGFVDHPTALRNAGVPNPLKIVAATRAEQFFNDPAVAQAFSLIAADRIPILQQALEAVGASETEQADATAANILNSQGSLQLPNPGNFGPGNQPGSDFGTESARIEPSTRPVIPGSLQEAQQTGAQIAGPRRGPQRVPGADLGPGLGGR